MPPEVTDTHHNTQQGHQQTQRPNEKFVIQQLSARDVDVVCEFDKILFPTEAWCVKIAGPQLFTQKIEF